MKHLESVPGPTQLATCREVVGQLDSHAAILVAVEALEAGEDSPALRILAGLESHEEADALDWWRRARRELGITLPDVREAAAILCRHVAQDILSSEVEPGEGAWRILDLWEHLSLDPEQFDRFFLAADLWGSEPKHRATYRGDILAVARALLDETPGSVRDP